MLLLMSYSTAAQFLSLVHAAADANTVPVAKYHIHVHVYITSTGKYCIQSI